MKLRDLARGKPCMVRLPEICTHDPETTVLAHLRMAGITGGSQKAPDILGAWACHECHREVDRQTRRLELDYVRMCFLEGMARTQYQLIRDGVIKA